MSVLDLAEWRSVGGIQKTQLTFVKEPEECSLG